MSCSVFSNHRHARKNKARKQISTDSKAGKRKIFDYANSHNFSILKKIVQIQLFN